MTLDALDEKMRLITIVDAAMEILIIGVWVGFRRPGGGGLHGVCKHWVKVQSFGKKQRGKLPLDHT